MTPEEIAAATTEYAGDVKAEDLVTLDLREYISYTDYFVICTGRSDRQVKAIHDRIAEGMKHEHEMLPIRADGVASKQWILLDYGDVVVHIFTARRPSWSWPAPERCAATRAGRGPSARVAQRSGCPAPRPAVRAPTTASARPASCGSSPRAARSRGCR
jgi:ribosome-associated protein